jgi:diadenosine tetraphosphate (Ap4A) HIT family hydrolase
VRLGDLPPGDAGAILDLGVRVAAAMRAGAVPCDDAHFVVNDGRAAFQSVPHVHLHVVPRAKGDSWRLLGRLLRHPLTPLLGPTARDVLDAQADAIRTRLQEGSGPR